MYLCNVNLPHAEVFEQTYAIVLCKIRKISRPADLLGRISVPCFALLKRQELSEEGPDPFRGILRGS